MQELPLNALRAFAVVYSAGGIRAAARELAVAHSSVSRHLKELEAWLGVPLVRQAGGRNGLLFTPQGDALGKAVVSGLNDMERVIASVREARSARSVVIATTASFASRWLLPRLPAFETSHRGVEVSLVVEQALSSLDGGEADFAIRMGRGPWPDLDCRPLMDDALYPVMSPSLWAKTGRPGNPRNLARLRLLHDRDPQTSWDAWKRKYGPATLNVRKGPRLASSDLLLRAAMQGQGVALARHRLADDDVNAGLLVRPMKALSIEIGPSYWIVRSRRSAMRPVAATVMDWLMKQAKTCGAIH
ncbi:MAG: LysR substrate-binding domain-containing protein [Gammaproteobacteria bacterium]